MVTIVHICRPQLRIQNYERFPLESVKYFGKILPKAKPEIQFDAQFCRHFIFVFVWHDPAVNFISCGAIIQSQFTSICTEIEWHGLCITNVLLGRIHRKENI